jgi:hypothetical protein
MLETLRDGPDRYGPTQHQRECEAQAKKTILEAKEPLEYRKKLLDALISYNRIDRHNDDGLSE